MRRLLRPFVILLLVVGSAFIMELSSVRAESGEGTRNGGYLGFFIRETADAVRIERLHPGSMAASTGFKAGDVIQSVNGKPLENGDAFIRWLWSGRRLKVVVKRGDQELVFETSTRELDALPQLEDLAPDFTLPSKDGKGTYSLKALLERGKPVVLVFGSFT